MDLNDELEVVMVAVIVIFSAALFLYIVSHG